MERYSAGLLLHLFKSDKKYLLPIPEKSVRAIILTEGEEAVDTWILSPMGLLLKLGIPLEIARYFRTRMDTYVKHDTKLVISTDSFKIELTTNGFTFPSQARFFKRLRTSRLKIEMLNR